MKKIFLTFAVLASSVVFCSFDADRLPVQESNVVYICMGPKAYAYHTNPECSGLRRCSAEVREVSVKDAVEIYHRKPCEKCCK